MRKILLVLAFITSRVANAAPVVVDFEEPGLPASPGEVTSFESQDFLFDVGVGGLFWVSDGSNPSLTIGNYETVEISATMGSTFSLDSLDLATIFQTVTVIGHLSGGGTIQADRLTEGFDLVTNPFDSSWSSLSKVSIVNSNSQGIRLDNVSLTAVPVPAAAWLFGSALAGLGILRRRVNAL